MKILLPYSLNLGKGFNDSVITGGVEKFSHSIYDVFDDVEILEIDNPKDFKTNTTLIKNSAIECGADIIILNRAQGSFCGVGVLDSPVPMLLVCHEKPSMPSVLKRLYRFRDAGHSLCFVSEYQKTLYDRMTKRQTYDAKFVEIDSYINSAYVTGSKPKLVEPEYDCCTIGRCDTTEKKPFLMKTMLKDTKIRNLLMTNTPPSNCKPVTYSYYKKNQHWGDTLWDLDYSEVMNNLSKCKTYFSTWSVETWGITALEALSHGIPIILNSDVSGDHASKVIPARPSHYTTIPTNDKDALVKAIKSFNGIDRKEIQDMTWEKHSLENWKTHFSNCIDKTIERFNNKSRATLNEFF